MFKRFKKVLVCALALSMALTVTACGSDDRGGSGRKTTINFYTWGNTNDQVLMGQVEEAFEKAYPQYDINYEFAAGGVYSDNVIQKIGGGNAPDIFHVEPSNFALFAKSGLLADMSPYIGQELEDDLFPLNDGYRYDASTGTIGEGGLHALIKDWCCSFPLVFNKGLVEQYNTRTGKYAGVAGNDQIVIPEVTLNADGTANIPDPLKWSEFVEIAKKLTVNKGGQGAVYGTTMDYVPYMHLQEFIEQTGYSWFAEDESEMEINAGVREAFEYYTDLTKGESAPSPSGSALSVGGEMFANEQVATVFYGSWAVPSYNWVGKGIDIGIAPVLSSVSVTPLPEITIAATVPSEKQQKEEPFTFAATASAEPDGALTYEAFVAESGITATWDGNTVTVSAIPFEFADASLDIELKAYPENRSFAAVSKTVSVPVDTPVLPNFVIPGQTPTLYRGRTHTISDVRVTDTEETLIFSAACPITDGEVSWDGSVLTVDVYETCESDYFNVQLTITLERDPRIVKTTMLVFKVQDAVYPEIELPSANVNIVKGNTKDFPLIVRYDGEVDVSVSTQAQGVVLAWEDDVLTVTVPETYEGESIVIAVKASAKDYEDCETEAQLTLTVSAIGESTVDGDSNVSDFENPEDKDPVPVGLIVGCSAAGVVVIGGAVWLVVWLRKRKSLK